MVRAFLSALMALVVSSVPTFAAADTMLNARDATAVYADPAAALAGGYELLTDAASIACIDDPSMGAMGVHFVKGALVQGGKIDPARPQALVYEPQADGHLKLVAVEYVVIKEGWDAAHNNTPPAMFGQTFPLTPGDNRYGLPAFYALHAWVGKDNPSGEFASYNPSVRCGGANPDEAAATELAPAIGMVCALPE
jgi:hypothetical protein